MRPLTDHTCKPMVEVSGIPLLARQVAWLRDNGVSDVLFLTGYRGETVRDYFKDGDAHGIRAHYSQEESPLGRGGCIKRGMSLLPSDVDDFVVVNGDILTDQDLGRLVALRRERDATVSMMLAPYVSEYGVVESDITGRVTAFREKAKLPHWVNAGVYVFHRRIWSELPDIGDHETETFPSLATRGEIVSVQSRALWVSVDNPKDVQAAEEMLD